MLPVFAAALAEIAVNAVRSILPETPIDKLALLKLQIEQQAQQNELLKGQLEVNTAEAANPNRKWMTWREVLGYGCSLAVLYTLLVRPLLVDILTLLGVENVSKLPVVDITQLFKLLLSMLGIGV